MLIYTTVATEVNLPVVTNIDPQTAVPRQLPNPFGPVQSAASSAANGFASVLSGGASAIAGGPATTSPASSDATTSATSSPTTSATSSSHGGTNLVPAAGIVIGVVPGLAAPGTAIFISYKKAKHRKSGLGASSPGESQRGLDDEGGKLTGGSYFGLRRSKPTPASVARQSTIESFIRNERSSADTIKHNQWYKPASDRQKIFAADIPERQESRLRPGNPQAGPRIANARGQLFNHYRDPNDVFISTIGDGQQHMKPHAQTNYGNRDTKQLDEHPYSPESYHSEKEALDSGYGSHQPYDPTGPAELEAEPLIDRSSHLLGSMGNPSELPAGTKIASQHRKSYDSHIRDKSLYELYVGSNEMLSSTQQRSNIRRKPAKSGP